MGRNMATAASISMSGSGRAALIMAERRMTATASRTTAEDIQVSIMEDLSALSSSPKGLGRPDQRISSPSHRTSFKRVSMEHPPYPLISWFDYSREMIKWVLMTWGRPLKKRQGVGSAAGRFVKKARGGFFDKLRRRRGIQRLLRLSCVQSGTWCVSPPACGSRCPARCGCIWARRGSPSACGGCWPY